MKLARQRRLYIRASAKTSGEKLRNLRKHCGFGIAEAAGQAKISAGFLSAIELSQANPSVATLQRLAAIYSTTVLEFYDLPRKPSAVMKPEMRPLLRTEAGVAMELLATGTKMLQSMLFRVPPGSGSDGSYSHAGEEFIYMLQGTLEIWLDELECHVLHEGDGLLVDGKTPAATARSIPATGKLHSCRSTLLQLFNSGSASLWRDLEPTTTQAHYS